MRVFAGYGVLGVCFCHVHGHGLSVPVKVLCNWNIKLAVARLSFPMG